MQVVPFCKGNVRDSIAPCISLCVTCYSLLRSVYQGLWFSVLSGYNVSGSASEMSERSPTHNQPLHVLNLSININVLINAVFFVWS